MTVTERRPYVGQPLDRLDGVEKVTGRARYSAEYPADNVAHAALVGSTIARGRIVSIDTAAALAVPGVLTVMTHENAPRMSKTKAFDPSKDAPVASAADLTLLNTDRIVWNGQPVAVVVAETLEIAEQAAALVEITYQREAAQLTLAEGRDDARVPEAILGEPAEIEQGDAERALAAAPVKVDQVYTTPPLNHNAIEPHATLAYWEGDERLTVYNSSQSVAGDRALLADKFSIPPEGVRVVSLFVGGAFGSKGGTWPNVWLTAAAARVVGRPVKLMLTRAQNFHMAGGRTPTEQRVALGAEHDGGLQAIVHTGLSATSRINTFVEPFSIMTRHMYTSPNVLIRQHLTELDMVPPTFMRAPGEAVGSFALESAVDELAYALHMDPIALRLRNDTHRHPIDGNVYSIRHLRECFERGERIFDWARRDPTPRAMREDGKLIGLGVASAFYGVKQMPTRAKVILRADGSAVVQSAAHEMGMGTATVQRQHAADRLGLPLERVRFEYGDTLLPRASVSAGSSTTISVGAAVGAACDALLQQLHELHGDPERPLAADDYAALLERHGRVSLEAEGEASMTMNEEDPHALGSFGAQFCEVAVDELTGGVEVRRFVGVYDGGRIINAKTAHSQFKGAIVMGLGMALSEQTHWDERDGRMPNASLSEYLVPVAAGVPTIETDFIDIADPYTPMGAHGIGEIGIVGVAAAVANAVYHATGKRVRDLPVTLDKLL